jgi:general secretion pathway protein K
LDQVIGFWNVSDDNGRRRTVGEQGFTFLVVIWALSILIMLALFFGASVSAHLKTTRNAVDNARAEALADAGVELAVLDISAWRAAAMREPRFPRNGHSTRCSLDNGDWLAIAVEDEVGKVDLNMADERLISAALLAAGVAEDRVARQAQRILDYRSPANTRRPLGAEMEEDSDQVRARAKNRPLDAVEEVEQVAGMPVGLADALRPYATIYSGQVTVDSNLAYRRLVAALTSRGIGTGSTLLSAAGSGRVFRILAQARTPQGAVFLREAVLEFVATQPGAYAFRRWRRGSGVANATVEDAPSVAGMPAC